MQAERIREKIPKTQEERDAIFDEIMRNLDDDESSAPASRGPEVVKLLLMAGAVILFVVIISPNPAFARFALFLNLACIALGFLIGFLGGRLAKRYTYRRTGRR